MSEPATGRACHTFGCLHETDEMFRGRVDETSDELRDFLLLPAYVPQLGKYDKEHGLMPGDAVRMQRGRQPKSCHADCAARVIDPPCQKLSELSLEADGVDGDDFMYSKCFDFCAANCRWPQDDDTMHCWAEYYKTKGIQA